MAITKVRELLNIGLDKKTNGPLGKSFLRADLPKAILKYLVNNSLNKDSDQDEGARQLVNRN